MKKTEEEIKWVASGYVDEFDFEFNEERQNAIDSFVAGAKWMQEQDNWIDPNITPPEIGKKCAFIVDSQNEIYNGQVYGGKYQGFNFGYHEFSMPGISFSGSLYQPLPEPPKH